MEKKREIGRGQDRITKIMITVAVLCFIGMATGAGAMRIRGSRTVEVCGVHLHPMYAATPALKRYPAGCVARVRAEGLPYGLDKGGHRAIVMQGHRGR